MWPTIYRSTHSPAEHFGSVGYNYLADKITDWSDAPDEDAPGIEHDIDRDRRVLDLLLANAPKDRTRRKVADAGKEEMVVLAGQRIGWHRALPELKCWAGQSTMLTVTAARVEAIMDTELDSRLLDWTVPLKTVSGIDARINTRAIDAGFSAASLGIDVYSYAACELLAILGMAISPIVRYGFREYGYVDPDGQWWQFRVVEREGYHRMYTMSEKCGVNGGP